MLEQLFGSRTRVKLLRLFLSEPEKLYFVREITRMIDERINSVRRELKNLEDMGLVLSHDKDQKRYYQANSDFILFPELRGLILKAQVILEDKLVSDIKALGNIQYMVLTGFFVGIQDNSTDILLVGKINRDKLTRLMDKFEKFFNRGINYTVMTTKEYKYRRDLTDRFLYDILENKNIVMIDKFSKVMKKDIEEKEVKEEK
ncbi:MAG: winged helix-turn-helix domain-containing protein [Patescibacteria group bacterium]|jgi:DNA-binding transcriptional ArsR family regulator